MKKAERYKAKKVDPMSTKPANFNSYHKHKQFHYITNRLRHVYILFVVTL